MFLEVLPQCFDGHIHLPFMILPKAHLVCTHAPPIDLHCSSNPLYCHLLHRWEKVLLIRTGLSPSPIHHHLTYCCSPCSCCCSPPHTHKHTVAQQFTLIESGLISYEVIIGCKQGCMSRELTFSRHQRKRGVEAGCVCVHVLASGHCTAPLSDQSSD